MNLQKTALRELLGLLLMTALLFAGWDSLIVLPLKLLVVFFHESAHALMTLATGGQIVSLSIVPEQGGLVQSRGGHRFLILSAGYLGSLLLGLGIFWLSVRTAYDRWLIGLCGALLVVLTLFYGDSGFTYLFGLSTGLILLVSAYALNERFNDILARVIGLSNLLYVPLDIYQDTLLNHQARSDAAMLAEEFGGHVWLWGGVWLAVSLLLIYQVLKSLLRELRTRVSE
ncbi:MAG: M50 family metallopeptidase [Methylococcales bacterium]|nr:M50 family metallopeptidase [Methylococcales bacterium]